MNPVLQPRLHNQSQTCSIAVNTRPHSLCHRRAHFWYGICITRGDENMTTKQSRKGYIRPQCWWLALLGRPLCTCQQQGLYGPFHSCHPGGRSRFSPTQSFVHAAGVAFPSIWIPVWHFLWNEPISIPVATPQTVNKPNGDNTPSFHHNNNTARRHASVNCCVSVLCWRCRLTLTISNKRGTNSPAFSSDGAAGWRSAPPLPHRPPSSL